MAYLTCNESFQGIKDRLKSFKGRIGNSNAFAKLKASLKDRKVRRGLGIGAGYLALSKLHHMNALSKFNRDAKDNNWNKINDNQYDEVKTITIKTKDKNGKEQTKSESKTIHHYAPTWTDSIMYPIYRKTGFQTESTELIPGTFVNEGIIDTVKDKVSGAVDSVGDFLDSTKKRVQTNVGNIANGINSVTDRIKGVANGIADGVSSVGRGISNFASNVVGSKNVKTANESSGFRIKPVSDYEVIHERSRFRFFPRKEVPKGRKIAGALGALGGYILAKRAHKKYGDENDNLEKYGSRFLGASAGSALSQALYNKMAGHGFTLDDTSEWKW